ncbi:MAG TPA: dihydrodipicolinate synthase family protein [Lacipirellulaceae bacterium]|nr:dihydrodipicolinate synthase family protein [Lacipirellulaceae bacterium]
MYEINFDHRQLSRRSFLQFTGLATALTAVPGKLLAEPARLALKLPLGPQEFKKRLAGPILSLPTTFNEDLTVNFDAIHKMIGRAIRYGVPIFELTAGNSKYQCLTYDEIKSVTQSMVQAVAGHGLTIAATAGWSTEQVIDYAKYSQALGADAIQILRPEKVDDEDAIIRHFQTISASTQLPIVLHGQYSQPLLKRLAEIKSIVAMKEDGELTYYIDRIITFGDRFEIFSGGAENRYLVGYPYGARAFFSTYTGFAPDKPMQFWQAIRNNNLKKAVAITTKYDYPFIRRFTHPFWHATLEYFGVAKRYMRKPFETLPQNQLDDVKSFFDGQGIHPSDYAA